MLYYFEAAEHLNRLKVDFISTDLDVALTFTTIASETTDREKAKRNQNNARKAYDTVVRYLGTATLSPSEEESITKKFALLKSALLKLGECF